MKHLFITLMIVCCAVTTLADDLRILPIQHASQTNNEIWGDCGATVMHMIDPRFSIEQIHYDMFGGDDKLPNATMYEMAVRARAAGMPVRAVGGVSLEGIIHQIDMGHPVGLYLWVGEYAHMVLVIGYDDVNQRLRVHDPANGMEWLSYEKTRQTLTDSGGWVWLVG